MPTMVYKKPNTYGGKKRRFGDEVEVSRHDVRLVTGLGWFVPQEAAAPQPPAVKAPAPKPATKLKAPVETQPPAAPAVEPAAPTAAAKVADEDDAPRQPKRAYQRRDLTAEDN